MWSLGQRAAVVARRAAVPGGPLCRPLCRPPPVAARELPLWGRFRPFCANPSPLGEGAGEAQARPRPGARRRNANLGKAAAAGAVVAVGAYAASPDVRDEVNNLLSRVADLFEEFNESSREFFENLGDMVVPKKQEPWLLDLATMKYPENIPTLVLDLDKVILHLEHDSRQGWHVIKRPFADQFFKEISHYYEIVIFSDDVFPVALDIATKWNLPVTGVLHRDFCKKRRSNYVKDLSKLGRKLDRVIMIDHDPVAFQLQPENGILIRPFEGDPNDSELMDLMDFLKAAATQPTDLREFVAKFGGGDQDLGRRYLLHKHDQDARVESRRVVGRAFASRMGFPPSQPGQFGATSSFIR